MKTKRGNEEGTLLHPFSLCSGICSLRSLLAAGTRWNLKGREGGGRGTVGDDLQRNVVGRLQIMQLKICI